MFWFLQLLWKSVNIIGSQYLQNVDLLLSRYFWKYRGTILSLVTVQKEVFSKDFPSWLRYFCKMSKQSIPLSKSVNMSLHKNFFSWNVIWFASFNIYCWRMTLSLKVHHHLNQCREQWCHNPMWCLDGWCVDLVLGGNPSLSCSAAPQPAPGIWTHTQQVTGSKLEQCQYSTHSFKICKTSKNNLISSAKKTTGHLKPIQYGNSVSVHLSVSWLQKWRRKVNRAKRGYF